MGSDRDMIQTLKGILETLLELHEQLTLLARAKKDAVMANDLGKLTEITSKESRLLKQIHETEERRIQAAQAILHQIGLPGHATLQELIRGLTSEADKRSLRELAERLGSVVKELKRSNDLNMTLIQQAKDFNDFSLDLLTGGNEADYIYGNPGASSARKYHIFDSRT